MGVWPGLYILISHFAYTFGCILCFCSFVTMLLSPFFLHEDVMHSTGLG